MRLVRNLNKNMFDKFYVVTNTKPVLTDALFSQKALNSAKRVSDWTTSRQKVIACFTQL